MPGAKPAVPAQPPIRANGARTARRHSPGPTTRLELTTRSPLRNARPATATGDGLGLVGIGKRHYREHRRQGHEQTEYSFAHHNSWRGETRCSPSIAGKRPLRRDGMAATARDSLQLIGVGKRHHGEYRRHEQAEHGFAHRLLLVGKRELVSDPPRHRHRSRRRFRSDRRQPEVPRRAPLSGRRTQPARLYALSPPSRCRTQYRSTRHPLTLRRQQHRLHANRVPSVQHPSVPVHTPDVIKPAVDTARSPGLG